MDNKKIYIGLGILAVVGIGYYIWQNKNTENKSNATGKGKDKKKKCPNGYSLQNGVCKENQHLGYTKSLYE